MLGLPRIAIFLVVLSERPFIAQGSPVDGVPALLGRLQLALDRNDSTLFTSLFIDTVPRPLIEQYWQQMSGRGAVRRVVLERERIRLTEAPRSEAFQVFVELFEETSGRARILSTRMTVRRAAEPDVATFRIAALTELDSVVGLYRLRVDTTTQYAARDLKIAAPDFDLSLTDGTVFLIQSDDGVTGLVLLGRGEMRFTPAPDAERGQLRLFAGRDTLVDRFDSAMIRLHPLDYPVRVSTSSLRQVTLDPRAARRALDVAARELPRSYAVDLRDMSPNDWHMLPRVDDFVAEVRTDRYGSLTFSRIAAQAEDVSLVHRDRRLTIALYRSTLQQEIHGRFYSEDERREYDVDDYDIAATVSPTRRFVRARARLRLVPRTSSTTLLLRLADPLTVSAVSSVESGALGFVRLKHQNAILIRLPGVRAANAPVTLTIAYSGFVEPQPLENETLPEKPSGAAIDQNTHLLQSSASLWYPQNPIGDYATATLRITVPEGYGCVGTGDPVAGDDPGPALPAAGSPAAAERTFVFRASQPLRYLAFVVGRLSRADTRQLTLDSAGAVPTRVALTVDTTPRQRVHARSLAGPLEDIVRFYATLMADTPYPSLALALVDADLPGGHSPGYFVMLNNPTAATARTWLNDPAAFSGFPEFFLAHEVAHQWWGHAVGTKNYHEHWISEGFAQYFAALYAQRAHGDRVFLDMLREFRSWSISESAFGPVHLGQRLGQIKGGPRVYRALVYNKGALVLHMLRRMVGDDVFFAALRRFYVSHRFQGAGTDDLQRAFEVESGRSLGRFFERWIYGTEIPRVGYRFTLAPEEVMVRLEQLGQTTFDLPVSLTLTLEDGRSRDVVVTMTEKQLEQRIEAGGRLRRVQINRDGAALATFESSR